MVDNRQERLVVRTLKKKLYYILILVIIPVIVLAYPFNFETCNLGYKHVHHAHNEASYQEAWCNAHGGVMEYENTDYTRVDCLTKTHAVEFDFANKWAESIGQALHYGIMTGKKPMVVLILDEPQSQMVYFKRVQRVGKKYKFDTEYITNDILHLDINGQCSNPRCKCHKQQETTNMQQNLIQPNIYTGA